MQHTLHRPGARAPGFDHALQELYQSWDWKQAVGVLGLKHAGGSAWDLRFRSSRSTAFVRVHVQSVDTGGRDYNSSTSVSSTRYDMREDRVREIEITAAAERFVFLIPEFLEVDGSYTRWDGVDGPDAMALVHITGEALRLHVTEIDSDTTLNDTHSVIWVDAGTGDVTLTLPAAASSGDRRYEIKRIDSSSNDVTIDGNGAETIDGETTVTLDDQWQTLRIMCDGATWGVMSGGLRADSNGYEVLR